MGEVETYMNSLAEKYGGGVELAKSTCDETALSAVPHALWDLYRAYSQGSLPFGDIYTPGHAAERSKAEPFASQGWFCFGYDRYFTFWLCKWSPDKEHLSFTAWDHGAGGEIGGAVFETVVQFLQDEQEEFEENRETGSVMLDELPDDKTRFLAALRRVFSLSVSAGELLGEIQQLPYCVAEEVPYALAEEMMDETGHPECFSFIGD